MQSSKPNESCKAQSRSSRKNGATFRTIQRLIGYLGATLVLASFTSILLGNRWVSYIESPISGVFVADALFAIGSILGLANVGSLRTAPRWMVLTFSAIWAYVLVVLLPEILIAPAVSRYGALRDAAPFLFLALAPFTSLVLLNVSERVLVWVTRWATVCAVGVFVATAIGAIGPTWNPILGSDYVRLFEIRSDLIGAAIGVGVIAWGQWQKGVMPSCPAVQVTFIILGFALISSRSGLIALLLATVIAIIRDFSQTHRLSFSLVAVLFLLGGLGWQTLGPSSWGTSLRGAGEAEGHVLVIEAHEDAKPHSPPKSSVKGSTSNILNRVGTVEARLETWRLIVTGMTRDATWLLGGASGSDYLYELCTGIPTAPVSVSDGDPKCPVDDAGPEPVVRDPHNWPLHITLYHGLLGLVVFSAAVAVPALKLRSQVNAMLPIGGLLTYLSMGLTFLISAGYALIPIAVFLAWLMKMGVSDGLPSSVRRVLN